MGFTGGAVFMYIQCRQYLHLFSRWKAHNRIILVQNAPEKPIVVPPSPNFIIDSRQLIPLQVMTHVEHNSNVPSSNTDSRNDVFYVFESEVMKKECNSSCSSIQKADVHVEDLDTPQNYVNNCGHSSLFDNNKITGIGTNILALDIECPTDNKKKFSLQQPSFKTDIVKNNSCVFKSLPNLNTSSENLLL